MAAGERDLLLRLKALGIPAPIHRHPPVFTVAEAQALRGDLPGGHCKNLLLSDRRGGLWLVVCLEDSRVEMRRLERALGTARLSFAKPDVLLEVLGVEPGSVSPLALINDTGRRVSVVLEGAMLKRRPLNYHPLSNEATMAIQPEDLIRFIESCGQPYRVLDFQGEEAAAAIDQAHRV